MNIFSRKYRRWQGVSYILLLSLLLLSYISCSEDDSTTDEFSNWQERNQAVTDQWAANSSLRKIRVFTQDDTTTGRNSDYIYVEVLEAGEGTDSPLYTDTVRMAYRGRLIPTMNYTNGFVFDETYIGDFSWHTAGMATMAIGGSSSALVSGFATAVMNMHKGDRWRVHIPYQLGYGASGNSSSSSQTIPGYTNLIFDIAVQNFWHQGEDPGIFKSR